LLLTRSAATQNNMVIFEDIAAPLTSSVGASADGG